MEQVKTGNAAVAHAFDTPAATPSSKEFLSYVQDKKAQDLSRPSTEFVFADEKILRIKEIVEQIAHANVPVLITGEPGTGKDVIARMIHQTSDRKQETFFAINCTAMSAAQLEAELFGTEINGVVTPGKFESVGTGTIVLDEVTGIDLALQAKLLRTVQDKEFERVGGHQAIATQARVIATTNKDINSLVREGSFRQDLFYRLYVINLEIPPLRQRPKDVEMLTRHFLRLYSQQFNRGHVNITAEAMAKLVKYTWPGNVRELQNAIQRAVLMSQGSIIAADDFPLEPKAKPKEQDWIAHLPIGRKMREIETHFILETLKQHQGNRTHSAKTLGISLRTLRNKINEFMVEGYDIPQPTSGKAQ